MDIDGINVTETAHRPFTSEEKAPGKAAASAGTGGLHSGIHVKKIEENRSNNDPDDASTAAESDKVPTEPLDEFISRIKTILSDNSAEITKEDSDTLIRYPPSQLETRLRQFNLSKPREFQICFRLSLELAISQLRSFAISTLNQTIWGFISFGKRDHAELLLKCAHALNVGGGTSKSSGCWVKLLKHRILAGEIDDALRCVYLATMKQVFFDAASLEELKNSYLYYRNSGTLTKSASHSALCLDSNVFPPCRADWRQKVWINQRRLLAFL